MNVREAFRGLPPLQIRPRPTAGLVSIASLIKPGERGEKHHPTGQYLNALRLEWDRPAPTLIANAFRSSSLVFHPDIDAGISIDEAKRLQSIPDQCALVGNYRQRWSLIGRSVPPLLMRAVAKHLREKILDKTDAKSGNQITETVAPFTVDQPTVITPSTCRAPTKSRLPAGPARPKMKLMAGDCRNGLSQLPPESVHCAVTSPPYYALRRYATSLQVWDDDTECAHVWVEGDRGFCRKCKAWRGELGLEPTPELYIQHLVGIFSEVHRVLRNDGVFFLDIGDKYCSRTTKTGRNDASRRNRWGIFSDGAWRERHAAGDRRIVRTDCGLPAGNLMGIPWRLALALQDAGWILRAEIIWHKRSAMPESVRNRPTRAHEPVFLFTKTRRYFYDADAIRETCVTGNGTPQGVASGKRFGGKANAGGAVSGYGQRLLANPANGRNSRDVWTLASQPYRGAHCAPMPVALAERCILAGTSAGGCCSGCGTPLVRTAPGLDDWETACSCAEQIVVPCTVLDMFAGASTTLLAAAKLGRSAIGIELDPGYCQLGARRVEEKTGLPVELCGIADEYQVNLIANPETPVRQRRRGTHCTESIARARFESQPSPASTAGKK